MLAFSLEHVQIVHLYICFVVIDLEQTLLSEYLLHHVYALQRPCSVGVDSTLPASTQTPVLLAVVRVVPNTRVVQVHEVEFRHESSVLLDQLLHRVPLSKEVRRCLVQRIHYNFLVHVVSQRERVLHNHSPHGQVLLLAERILVVDQLVPVFFGNDHEGDGDLVVIADLTQDDVVDVDVAVDVVLDDSPMLSCSLNVLALQGEHTVSPLDQDLREVVGGDLREGGITSHEIVGEVDDVHGYVAAIRDVTEICN